MDSFTHFIKPVNSAFHLETLPPQRSRTESAYFLHQNSLLTLGASETLLERPTAHMRTLSQHSFHPGPSICLSHLDLNDAADSSCTLLRRRAGGGLKPIRRRGQEKERKRGETVDCVESSGTTNTARGTVDCMLTSSIAIERSLGL